MICTVHPNTGLGDQESKLNIELNEIFPADNVEGLNSNYLDIRNADSFKKFFGDWANEDNPDIYGDIVNKADNTAILNEQGEPKLHYDITGNPYILNLQGRRKYIKPLFETVSSTEINSVVNTITGDYISYINKGRKEADPKLVSLSTYIKDKFSTDVANIEALVDKYAEIVKGIKVKDASDVSTQRKKQKKRKILLAQRKKLKQLKSIQTSPNLQALLNKRVVERLEKYNFKYNEDVETKENEAGEYNEIANFTMDSTETSNRAINDPEILSFLSSVPLFKNYDEDVTKQIPESNFLLSSNMYMDQNAVWSMLEGIFADVLPTSKNQDVFINFLNALNSTVANTKQAELNYTADFLNNLEDNVENPDQFKTKFVAAFFKSNQHYLITQITQEEVNGKYKTVFKIVDPSVKNNKIGKLSNQYIEEITNSPKFENAKDFQDAKKRLLEEYDKIRNTVDFDGYYSFLDNMLNSELDLNITPEILQHYMESKTSISFKPVRDDIEAFLENQVRSKSLDDYTLVYPEGEIELLQELRVNHSKNKKGWESEAKQAFKDRAMANGSFIKSIATAARVFTHDVSETSFMVGGSQRWAYSYTSGLHLEIGNWKNGNLSSLERLKTRGLKFVKHLLDSSGTAERVQDLKIYTNSEIKKENDSSPVLHKKITEIDYHLDNFVKMFNYADEYYEETTDKLQGKGSKREKKLKKLKNYIMYNFGADKNSLFALFGLPNPTEGMQIFADKSKTELSDDIKILLNDYVAGELIMGQNASDDIRAYFNSDNKKEFLMNNLIAGYHYNTKKNVEVEDLAPEDFAAGNYHKIGIFSSGLQKFKELNSDDVPLLYDMSQGYPIVRSDFHAQAGGMRSNKNLDKLMGHVYKDIRDAIQKNFDYLNDITLIRKEVENKDDSTSIKEVKLFEVETNMRKGDMENRLYEYITSGFLINYELSNIFNGHAAFYKQTSNTDIELTDFLKRAPAIATDGKYLHHRGRRKLDPNNKDLGKTYTDYNGKVHEIYDADDNIVVAISNNIDIKKSMHSDVISKATGQNMSFKHELADAQGYVTADHFRDLIERIYGWDEVDAKNFNELTNPKHNVTDENIRWIKTANKAFTPLKMVHFEVLDKLHPDEEAGAIKSGMPVYLKYSLAPLFPAMIAGSEMEIIANKMEDQGVEQLVFKSGSKASNATPTTIHKLDDKGQYAGIDENLKLNPFILDSNKIKMQVELPTKLDKDTKIGMQSPKNILTNLDLDDEARAYKFRDEYFTASEIYDKINTNAVTMLKKQLDNVLDELGYVPRDLVDENGDTIYEDDGVTPKKEHVFTREKVKKLLINQMDIETERDLINLLHTDLPLETIPNFGQRAFPVIAGFIAKQAGKIHTNGSSVVQVANVGYDRLSQKEADGVFYFGKQTKLEPPLPVTDPKTGEILYFDPETGKRSSKKEGGVMQISKSKILLPFASVFAKTGLSYDEFKNLWGKKDSNGNPIIDPEIFKNILGYRIPNQAMSSNDSFEVVGILPPIAGDQAVVYHEITAKTGSDFDIDKMYLALPNFKVKMKYTMLEEDSDMYKALSSKKPEIMALEYYMERYEFDKGGEILDLFSENKEAEKLIKSNSAYTEGKPIKAILNVADDLADIFEKDNSEKIIDGEPLEFLDVLDDLMAAHNRQITEAKELYKEINEKAWEFKKDKTFKTLDNITYVRNTEDNITQKGLQNEFIELMNSIIESGKSYNDLMSPLDSDIIKDTIQRIDYLKDIASQNYISDPNLSEEDNIKAHAASKKESGLEQMFPVSLLKSRVDVLEAKTLISIMANNMTDLGESQKVDFGLKYPLGIVDANDSVAKSLAITYMLNQDGNSEAKLSKIVSYLMNASVDAAKDNYIISGNFTSYTANGAMLMTRLGMPLDDLFTVLMNKEILEFSKYKTYQRAKLSDFSFDYNQEQLDEWSKKVLHKIADNNWDIFNVVPREDFLSNNPVHKENILGFWNLVQTMGKDFNDAVVAMKSETNGAGKNIPEFIALKNRLSKVMNGTTTQATDKWFKGGLNKDNRQFNPDIDKDPNVKMLGAMANNTLFLMEELAKDMFLETTPNAIQTVDNILTGLGSPLETSVDNIKLIYSYLYPYLLHETGHRIYNINKDREKYLLGNKPTDFPRKLQRYKKAKAFENRDHFLNQLSISTNKSRNLISFPNFKNFSTQDKNRYKEEINAMMNDEAILDSNSEFYNLVHDLVQYSFLTTGFKSTFYSFNDYLPAGYFLDSMHGKVIQEYIDKLNNGDVNVINPAQALTLIAKTHHNNYKIVKKLSGKFKRTNEGGFITSGEPITSTKTLEKLKIGDDAYAPFFKKSGKSASLYMKVKPETIKGTEYPVYEKITKIDNKDFNTYSFYDIEKGLSLDNIEYISPVDKLYEGVPDYINTSITESTKKC